MRVTAWLILIIPGVIAGIGINWMRNSFFDLLAGYFPYLWVQFTAGLLAFGFGIVFVGGFIFHREQKKSNARRKYQKRSVNASKPPSSK